MPPFSTVELCTSQAKLQSHSGLQGEFGFVRTHQFDDVTLKGGNSPRVDQVPRVGSANPRHRWATLAVLCVTLLLISLDNTVLNVALPSIVRSIGASSSQLQWMVDAYAVVFAGLLLSLGALGDGVGRKWV